MLIIINNIWKVHAEIHQPDTAEIYVDYLTAKMKEEIASNPLLPPGTRKLIYVSNY